MYELTNEAPIANGLLTQLHGTPARSKPPMDLAKQAP
jgi:hypothetical protein